MVSARQTGPADAAQPRTPSSKRTVEFIAIRGIESKPLFSVEQGEALFDVVADLRVHEQFERVDGSLVKVQSRVACAAGVRLYVTVIREAAAEAGA